jgi:hypothetical protein
MGIFGAYAYTRHHGNPILRTSEPCDMDSIGVQGKSLQQVKDIIDDAITNGAYLSLYTHPADFGTTYSGTYNGEPFTVVHDINFIEDILQYIIAKRDNGDIFFGSPDECAKYFFKL